MNVWLLGIVATIYLYVAGDYCIAGRYGMSLAFLAYSISNVGFILDALKV
jgi:hypothetical protein